MLGKPVIFDGSMQRQLARGDTVAGGEVIPATVSTATNLTITGAMLLAGLILRNPAGVSNENIDTAENIRAAVASVMNSASGYVQNGLTWRVRWILTTANALTVQATANTGVTVTRGTVAASTSKDFLVTVSNGTPAQNFSCTTTNASAVIGMTVAQAALLSIGMVVTNAVVGLQGTTIIGINGGSVTLSGNANATTAAPGISISFSPVILVEGLTA